MTDVQHTAYTLAGRSLEARTTPPYQDMPAAPCIFCSEEIRHFNDGGVGWCVGSLVGGKKQHFLYCDQPPCAATLKGAASIWRCGCMPDYVENVGAQCADCGVSRANAVPYA